MLALDGATSNATFLGDVSLLDNKKLILGTGNDLQIYHDGSNSYIQDTSGTGDLRIDTNTFRLRSANGGETMIRSFEDGAVILSHNNLDRLTTTSTGVSVTGEIGIGGATIIDTTATYTQIRNPESTRCIFLGDSGDASNYYDNTSHIFRSAGGAANYLTINGSLATFEDDVRIKGNLTVDGNIIHGSGGGTFNGNKAITSGSSALAFTLTRAVTGTLVFDVWLTSGTSNLSSVAKKYTVAHSFNSTPVYNKIIDTGPNNTNDFTVTFANSNTGANGTSVTCSIISNVIAANNIGYTVQVGHESVRALTFTAG